MIDDLSHFEKGARPIKSKVLAAHYQKHKFKQPNLDEYLDQWRQWLINSDSKRISGLDKFLFGDYSLGTSQVFDHFVIRHTSKRQIVVLRGEFQYHACISKKINFKVIDNANHLQKNQALILSCPFSDLGTIHPEFTKILDRCCLLDIPVCLDLAYWGISKDIEIDLDHYPCVQEITSSLSKPFFPLENHRVGVRFSREYLDDGISMINEVSMQNFYSMSLGCHFMQNFSSDWNWSVYGNHYDRICNSHNLVKTNTVIFGRSDQDMYQSFNRGISGNHRVCISKLLAEAS